MEENKILEPQKIEVKKVDPQKVEMYILSNRQYFPSEKLIYMKNKMF